MPQRRNVIPSRGFHALAAFGVAALVSTTGHGSDHQEAPTVGPPDAAADLGDLYAWHTDDGRLVVAFTYAGYRSPNTPAVYDADVLYEIHIDRDGDAIADTSIDIRFGEDGAGRWGVQALAVPGESTPIVGAIESTLTGSGGSRLWAGPRDDPFFFDFEGYLVTASTGTLAFDASRDFAVFQNANAVVIEMDTDAALAGESTLALWATTARLVAAEETT